MAYGNGTNTPFGFRPSQYLDGSTWNQQTTDYLILPGYATALFTGDLVAFAADGTINRATAGDGNTVCGVFMGCKYQATSGEHIYSPYWPASTATLNNTYPTAFVVDDPNVLFDVQVSNSQNVAPTAATVSVQQAFGGTTQFFNNANFGLAGGGGAGITNPATGSTVSGQSAMYLDANTIASGNATRVLKIIRFTPVPNNVSGVLYNNVLVLINNHVTKGGTGTVGV